MRPSTSRKTNPIGARGWAPRLYTAAYQYRAISAALGVGGQAGLGRAGRLTRNLRVDGIETCRPPPPVDAQWRSGSARRRPRVFTAIEGRPSSAPTTAGSEAAGAGGKRACSATARERGQDKRSGSCLIERWARRAARAGCEMRAIEASWRLGAPLTEPSPREALIHPDSGRASAWPHDLAAGGRQAAELQALGGRRRRVFGVGRRARRGARAAAARGRLFRVCSSSSEGEQGRCRSPVARAAALASCCSPGRRERDEVGGGGRAGVAFSRATQAVGFKAGSAQSDQDARIDAHRGDQVALGARAAVVVQ